MGPTIEMSDLAGSFGEGKMSRFFIIVFCDYRAWGFAFAAFRRCVGVREFFVTFGGRFVFTAQLLQ
jgi:hypothetical protein